jgi:Transglycosylase SLT domain
MPIDRYAYPDIGVPTFSPVGSAVDRRVVYSIVRTESGFDQRDMSAAKAVGLMQVTPGAGRSFLGQPIPLWHQTAEIRPVQGVFRRYRREK